MNVLETKFLRPLALAALLTPTMASASEDFASSELNAGAYLAYSMHHTGRAGENNWGTQNNSSRWHLDGKLSGKGLEAFGYYERGIAIDDGDTESSREAFVGFNGAFGTLTVGRQSTRYKRAGVAVDPFYDTTHGGSGAQLTGAGPSYGLSPLTDGSAPGTVSYESPLYEGFLFSVATYLDKSETQDHDAGAGISYADEESGLSGGLHYLNLGGVVVPGMSEGGSAWRLHAGWRQGRWNFGSSVELLDRDGQPNAERYYYLTGSYAMRENLRLAAAYGRTEETATSGDALAIGGFYQVFDAFTLYASAHRLWLDVDQRLSVALGVSFSFDRSF